MPVTVPDVTVPTVTPVTVPTITLSGPTAPSATSQAQTAWLVVGIIGGIFFLSVVSGSILRRRRINRSAPQPTAAATQPTTEDPPTIQVQTSPDHQPVTATPSPVQPESPPPVSQENDPDLATVIDVLHRARLSPTERHLVGSINAQLTERLELDPPTSPPPMYSEYGE